MLEGGRGESRAAEGWRGLGVQLSPWQCGCPKDVGGREWEAGWQDRRAKGPLGKAVSTVCTASGGWGAG